jgi:isoleucyl-tRNA synthetase
MVFIVSAVQLASAPGDDLQVTVERAQGVKCERCWRVVPSVSSDPLHPGICDRCEDALAHAVAS